jgi:hypothetical protein
MVDRAWTERSSGWIDNRDEVSLSSRSDVVCDGLVVVSALYPEGREEGSVPSGGAFAHCLCHCHCVGVSHSGGKADLRCSGFNIDILPDLCVRACSF